MYTGMALVQPQLLDLFNACRVGAKDRRAQGTNTGIEVRLHSRGQSSLDLCNNDPTTNLVAGSRW